MKRKNPFLRFVAVLTTIVVCLYISSGNIQILADTLRADAAESETVLGDLNGDNVVDVFDLLVRN